MAWQDTALPMLRVIISDIDTNSPTYSDDRLEEILVVCAMYVQQEMDFSTTYTISVPTRTISPDPVTNNDSTFLNFIVLKAACVTDWSTYRTEALRNGLEAKLGPAELKVKGERLTGFKELITQGPCAAYEQLKMEYEFSGDGSSVRAVLSPFVGNNYDPISLNYRNGYYFPRE